MEGVRMIDITTWVEKFSIFVQEAFPDRVRFIGLQGSYGREEDNNLRFSAH